MNTFKLVFLGTGTSVGVPVVGCECEVCTSPNPKNKRFRSSVFLESAETKLLVDTGPDLRQQSLREGLTAVDAVLYTHSHLDHVAGFDELRAFCWHREERLPLHANQETLDVLTRMYPWAFADDNHSRGYVRPEKHVIHPNMQIGDFSIEPIAVHHSTVDTHGYLFQVGTSKKVAYMSDLKYVKEESLSLLQDVDVLITDSLRYADRPHATHMAVEEACALAEQVNAKQLYLTHISHEVEHEEVDARTPDWVTPAYDGLQLEF